MQDEGWPKSHSDSDEEECTCECQWKEQLA